MTLAVANSVASDQAPRPTPLGKGALPSREEAVKVAKQFEGIFVQMLIKDMRESAEALGEGLFGDGAGSSIQSGLFDSMLSDKLAKSGRIGLADALVRDWESKGHVAKDSKKIQAGLRRLGAAQRGEALESLRSAQLTRLIPEDSETGPVDATEQVRVLRSLNTATMKREDER